MTRLALMLIVLLLAPMSAHAYFDPGAGAVLLQVLVAAGIGAAYKLRHWFGHLLRVIKGLFRR